MMELGVFGGAYFGLNINEYPKSWFKNAKISKNFDVNLNRFKIVSGLSREHWIEKGWIFKEDPLGWFQWYCRFTNGRRIPQMDEVQIKRWKTVFISFKNYCINLVVVFDVFFTTLNFFLIIIFKQHIQRINVKIMILIIFN